MATLSPVGNKPKTAISDAFSAALGLNINLYTMTYVHAIGPQIIVVCSLVRTCCKNTTTAFPAIRKRRQGPGARGPGTLSSVDSPMKLQGAERKGRVMSP